MITIDFAEKLAPQILENYFEKRAACYQRQFRLPSPPARDRFDARSYFALATNGNECLGGMRTTVRHSPAAGPLPMEVTCPGLCLKNLFPQLSLDTTPHAEISKLIVHSNEGLLSFQNEIVDRLLKFMLITNNPEPSVPFVFIVAPRLQMRLYTLQAKAMGVSFDVRALPQENWPPELHPFAPVMIQACYLGQSRVELN